MVFLHSTYKALGELVGEDNMMEIYCGFRGTQLRLPMKRYYKKSCTGVLQIQFNRYTRKSGANSYSANWTIKVPFFADLSLRKSLEFTILTVTSSGFKFIALIKRVHLLTAISMDWQQLTSEITQIYYVNLGRTSGQFHVF